MTISAEVRGTKKVVDRITAKRRATRKATRRALSLSLTELQKGIKQAAPQFAKRAVGKRVIKATTPAEADGKVGLHVGKWSKQRKRGVALGQVANRGNKAPHAHLIELGTRNRYTLKTNAFRGRVTPRPFVRRGANAAQSRAHGTFARVFDETFKAAQ